MLLRCQEPDPLHIQVLSGRSPVVMTLGLVKAGYANANYLSLELPQIEAEGAINWRSIHVDQLDVQARVAGIPGVIITANNEFFRVSILAENIGSRPVEFYSFRHDHVSQLNVEAIIPHYADRQRPVRNKIVQFPVVALALEEQTTVFYSRSCGNQLIARLLYRHTVGKCAGVKYVEAVRKTERCVA